MPYSVPSPRIQTSPKTEDSPLDLSKPKSEVPETDASKIMTGMGIPPFAAWPGMPYPNGLMMPYQYIFTTGSGFLPMFPFMGAMPWMATTMAQPQTQTKPRKSYWVDVTKKTHLNTMGCFLQIV
jgi:hypothetical protein